MTDKGWLSKEKRELFAKCVNTLLMRLPEGKGGDMKYILGIAKEAVDTAFRLYPNSPEGDEPVEMDFKK